MCSNTQLYFLIYVKWGSPKSIKTWLLEIDETIDWSKFGIESYWKSIEFKYKKSIPVFSTLKTKLAVLGLEFADFRSLDQNSEIAIPKRESTLDLVIKQEIERICLRQTDTHRRIIEIRELIDEQLTQLGIEPMKWNEFSTIIWEELYKLSNKRLPTEITLRNILKVYNIKFIELRDIEDRDRTFEKKLNGLISQLQSKKITKETKIKWFRKYLDSVLKKFTGHKINWFQQSIKNWNVIAKSTNFQLPKYEVLAGSLKSLDLKFTDLVFNLDYLLSQFKDLPLEERKTRVARMLDGIYNISLSGMSHESWTSTYRERDDMPTISVIVGSLGKIGLTFGQVTNNNNLFNFNT